MERFLCSAMTGMPDHRFHNAQGRSALRVTGATFMGILRRYHGRSRPLSGSHPCISRSGTPGRAERLPLAPATGHPEPPHACLCQHAFGKRVRATEHRAQIGGFVQQFGCGARPHAGHRQWPASRCANPRSRRIERKPPGAGAQCIRATARRFWRCVAADAPAPQAGRAW
ncbi:hypothetical protein D3C72_1045110 [compost metagenome]